jgi:hypothetical protein
MSTWLQAHKTTDGSLANTMFLPLAEKLMEKYVAEKKLDVEEGLFSPLSVFLHSSLSSFLVIHTVLPYSYFFLVSCCECCDAVTVWMMLVNYDQPKISNFF